MMAAGFAHPKLVPQSASVPTIVAAESVEVAGPPAPKSVVELPPTSASTEVHVLPSPCASVTTSEEVAASVASGAASPPAQGPESYTGPKICGVELHAHTNATKATRTKRRLNRKTRRREGKW
jgi:hypothetical protein